MATHSILLPRNPIIKEDPLEGTVHGVKKVGHDLSDLALIQMS